MPGGHRPVGRVTFDGCATTRFARLVADGHVDGDARLPGRRRR